MPFGGNAQDAGLTAAYEAYVAASSGDDADAKAAAEAAFRAECERVGTPDLDGCIAIATGAARPLPNRHPPLKPAPAEHQRPSPRGRARPAEEPRQPNRAPWSQRRRPSSSRSASSPLRSSLRR